MRTRYAIGALIGALVFCGGIGASAQGTISGGIIRAGTTPLTALNQSSATTGQVAEWNGTAWVPVTPAGATYTFSSPLSLSGSNVTLGNVPVTLLNSGTGASSTTFWRGDGTWATPAGTVYVGTAPVTVSGTTISMAAATTSVNGYLTSTDWNTFNGKQAAGNYITALAGDGTASGPGSATLAITKIGGFTYPASWNVGASILYNGSNVVTVTPGSVGVLLCASTSNVASLSGTGGVMDGVTLATNNQILLTAQSTASQNGPWTVASGSWTRPQWWRSTSAMPAGCYLRVYGGTSNSGFWLLSGTSAVTVDSSSETWTLFSAGGSGTVNSGTSGQVAYYASSGTAVSGESKVGLSQGGTNADLSATGGTGQYVKQSSSGGALTVGTIPVADLPVMSNTQQGIGQADNSTIIMSGGVFSASTTAIATNAIQPLVKSASNFTNTTSLWKFDAGSGTTVPDAVGSNTLTMTNSSAWLWGTDAYGNYLVNAAGSLNGWLATGNNGGVTGTGDFFTEILFMPQVVCGAASSNCAPMTAAVSTSFTGTNRVTFLIFGCNSAGINAGVSAQVAGGVYNTTPTSFTARASAWFVPGQMCHLVVTYSSSTKHCDLIWNGVLVGTSTLTGTRQTVGDIVIGQDVAGNSYFCYDPVYLASCGNHYVTPSEAATRYAALMK